MTQSSPSPHRDGIPAQTQPGLEAAVLVSTSVPSDGEAGVVSSSIPDGDTTYLTETVKIGAAAQGLAGRIEANELVAKRAAAETPMAFDAGRATVARFSALAEGAQEAIAQVQGLLTVSLDRTRGVVWKVMAIYVALALGEVFLNTSAAVAQGEVVLVAVASFIGLAAYAAVGWVVGSTAKDMADRLLRGPCPEAAKGTALESMFRPNGRWYKAATPDLVAWIVVLLLLAYATGALVGNMRAAAGMSTAWGPVAAIVVLAAAAPPYVLRNRACDLIDAAAVRLDVYTAAIDSRVPAMDRHTSAQQLTQAAIAEVPDRSMSQRLAALAGGYGQLAAKQSHVLGHTLATSSSPADVGPVVVPSCEVEFSPWLRAGETDHERMRRERAGGKAGSRPPAAPPNCNVDLTGADGRRRRRPRVGSETENHTVA